MFNIVAMLIGCLGLNIARLWLSQRKHFFLMEKPKRKDAEKQEQAAMCLAKQKYETVMRKKELELQMEQMALQELEEGHRQRFAAAKLDKAELMDNRSLFSHHSS